MKKFNLLFVLSVILLSVGCAGIKNDIAKSGGFWGTYAGDYIIRNDSGGKIMDIWKLENVYVQSEEKSDGWNFIDQNGNVIMLSGDVKIIRVNNKKIWDSYHEYHAEFNNVSYQELYAQP